MRPTSPLPLTVNHPVLGVDICRVGTITTVDEVPLREADGYFLNPGSLEYAEHPTEYEAQYK